MTVLRRLNVARDEKEPLKIVKQLDAFPKVEECYVETNARSGGVSLLMFALIAVLVTSEIYYYAHYEVVYEYGIDMDPSSIMKIYVDMTIATPCHLIGADLLDSTGKHAIDHENMLEEINTVFEMTSEQKIHHEQNRIINQYLQARYHSMHENVWDMGYSNLLGYPERSENDKTPKDACRLKGTLSSRKLSGNFHVTLGKPIQMFGGGHAHLSVFGAGDQSLNFSHRIHHLSFGERAPGKVYPLDGDEHITNHGYHIYQYFLKIVPTKILTKYANVDTFQYAVTERDRPINHSAGSHGTPGIFFKYDMSPIKVFVEQRYKPLWKFLIRLCGIVGGIFACTGILNSLIELSFDIICCRFKLGKYSSKSHLPTTSATNSLLSNLPQDSNIVTSTQPTLASITTSDNIPVNYQINGNSQT